MVRIAVNTTLMAPPLERELRFRAAGLRLVITDVDGTLTDGTVFYSERGEAMKRFSLRDGMGVERLRADGIETAFLTRERSPIVARRAEKLQIKHLHEGVADKAHALAGILAQARCELSQVAYIGDDLNDLEAMRKVSLQGLVAAPLDAVPQVLHIAHHRCGRPGGAGAFREFAEWILGLREMARRPDLFDTSVLDEMSDQEGGL